jgi:phage gpG-like protein
VDFHVDMPNWGRVAASIVEKAGALDTATKVGVGLVAHRAEAAAKQELARKSHKKNTPTPSQPGEPPATVSGSLMRSIQVQGPTGLGGMYSASTGPTMIYSRIQELGGAAGKGHRVALPARPYMAPALAKTLPEIRTIMVGAWRRAMGV